MIELQGIQEFKINPNNSMNAHTRVYTSVATKIKNNVC